MLRPGQSSSAPSPPPPPPPPAPSSSSAPPAPLELPSTDHDDVIDAERAYEAASRAAAAAAAAAGGGGASSSSSSQAAAAAADADDKAFQLVWALVHSSWQSDARRGRELAAALQAKAAAAAAAAAGGGGGGERARELAYLEAVGAWKTGDSVAARKLLAAILAATPHSRQAGALKAAVDDQIVRDGLLGIGIGAAAVAALGCVLAMAFGSRR